MEFVYIWLSKQNISPANFFSLVVTFRFSDISDMMFCNGEWRFESPFNRSRRSSDLPITGVLNVERFLGTVGITFFWYITLLLFLIHLSLSLSIMHTHSLSKIHAHYTHTHKHIQSISPESELSKWERERFIISHTLLLPILLYFLFVLESSAVLSSDCLLLAFLRSCVRSTVAQWWSIVKIYFSFASFPWWSLF